MRKFASLDIGGTSIKYGVVNDEGKVICKFSVPTEAQNGAEKLMDKVILKIHKLLSIAPELEGIGISTAGAVDTENGVIVYANENLPGYKGMHVKNIIEDHFKLPVKVNNDVNCAAIAEHWVGSAVSKDTFFCITIGTGIGGAAFINGKLFKGKNFRACEIGYLGRNEQGSYFEKLASMSSFVGRIKKELNANVDGIQIFENIKNGNAAYINIYNEWICEIAKGLSDIIYLFDPGLIVIGGGVSAQKDFFINGIRDKMANFLPNEFLKGTEIKSAECGNDAGIIGAVYDFIV